MLIQELTLVKQQLSQERSDKEKKLLEKDIELLKLEAKKDKELAALKLDLESLVKDKELAALRLENVVLKHEAEIAVLKAKVADGSGK